MTPQDRKDLDTLIRDLINTGHVLHISAHPRYTRAANRRATAQAMARYVNEHSDIEHRHTYDYPRGWTNITRGDVRITIHDREGNLT